MCKTMFIAENLRFEGLEQDSGLSRGRAKHGLDAETFAAELHLKALRATCESLRSFAASFIDYRHTGRNYLATILPPVPAHTQHRMPVHNTGSAQLISLSDALLKEPLIKMLKIDIEGSEVNALRGARKLFENKRVENMVVEVSPGWWKRNGVTFPEGTYAHRTPSTEPRRQERIKPVHSTLAAGLLVFKELVDKFGFSAWALDGCGMPTSVCVPTSTKTPELVRGVIKDGRTGTAPGSMQTQCTHTCCVFGRSKARRCVLRTAN